MARWARTSFITLTITEKGYCHIPGTTDLDPDSAIAADLASPQKPVTAIGFLCRLLDMRRLAGGDGLTIASCDNIPANGRLLQSVMEQFAVQAWPELTSWMRDNVAFPNSMVDRIVPAMSAESRAALEAALGSNDGLGVVAEPFRQWVLEDVVAGDRPPFEQVGVQVVTDVAPYEHMKHRMLNGLQSSYAELGRLCGLATSYEAATDPVLAAWARLFHDVQAKTLVCPPDEDLAAYGRVSLERLANPTIVHPLGQIATDGSFKLSQRIAEPAAQIVASGGDATCHAMVLAAWMLQAGEQKPDASGYVPSDPQSTQLADLRRRHTGDAVATAGAFLELPLFPLELGKSAGFFKMVVRWLGVFGERLKHPEMVRRAIADIVKDPIDA
jgi:fructuronate reductase